MNVGPVDIFRENMTPNVIEARPMAPTPSQRLREIPGALLHVPQRPDKANPCNHRSDDSDTDEDAASKIWRLVAEGHIFQE